jgi:hypothetical protein
LWFLIFYDAIFFTYGKKTILQDYNKRAGAVPGAEKKEKVVLEAGWNDVYFRNYREAALYHVTVQAVK